MGRNKSISHKMIRCPSCVNGNGNSMTTDCGKSVTNGFFCFHPISEKSESRYILFGSDTSLVTLEHPITRISNVTSNNIFFINPFYI